MMTDAGELVQLVTCMMCRHQVAGVDDDGACPGCRAQMLLSPSQQRLLRTIRRLSAGRRGAHFTVGEIATASGQTRSPSYDNLRALRRHGFVDWVDGAAATIHLTRGLGR